jgi:DUF4097 and DUF4098 domain-containing protein YvlB
MPAATRMFLVLRTLLFAAAAAAAPADVTDRVARTVAISAATPISLQITVGDVQVSGWDRDDVSVEILRRAPDARRLARIPAVVEQGSDGLRIRAVQADAAHDARLRTDVVLHVPSAARLNDISVFEGRVELSGLRGACSAHLERGNIVGRNLSGAIRLETAIGNIRLDTATLSPEGLMRLRTFNGDVALELAAKPEHARILALSMGGTITSDIPLTRRERWGPRFGEATLGRGEPLISIDVVNGNVAISVAGAAR